MCISISFRVNILWLKQSEIPGAQVVPAVVAEMSKKEEMSYSPWNRSCGGEIILSSRVPFSVWEI